MTGSIFEAMCQPFQWDQSSHDDTSNSVLETEVKPASSSQLFDKRWMVEDEVPSLMLSDTEDDSSLPEYPPSRKSSLDDEDDDNEQKDSMRGRRAGDGEVGLSPNRHVRFGEAQIREHPMIPGGGCCNSFTLSLDWGYQDERVYPIDDYETMREQSGRKERGKVTRIGSILRKRIFESWEECSSSSPCRVVGGEDDNNIQNGMNNHMDQYQSGFNTTAVSSSSSSSSRSHCRPLPPIETIQDSTWDIFGCNHGAYPSMTVQILED